MTLSLAWELLKRFWLPVVVIVLVAAGAAYLHHLGYESGLSDANATWQDKWDKRDKADSEAAEQFQTQEREKEQARQKSIEQVTADAQTKIDSAHADADRSRAASQRLQRAADALATQLAIRANGVDSCAAASSATAAKTARMYADVLGRLDDRAGKLASVADEAIERGNACSAAYGKVRDAK